jgi:hypothetical protein
MLESLVFATRGLRFRTIGVSSARTNRRRQFFHMRCFTDDELRRGLDTVILEWDRCTVCGGHSDQAHRDEARDHVFQPGDLIDVFLKGVSQQAEPDAP